MLSVWGNCPQSEKGSLVARTVKNPPTMQENWIQSLSQASSSMCQAQGSRFSAEERSEPQGREEGSAICSWILPMLGAKGPAWLSFLLQPPSFQRWGGSTGHWWGSTVDAGQWVRLFFDARLTSGSWEVVLWYFGVLWMNVSGCECVRDCISVCLGLWVMKGSAVPWLIGWQICVHLFTQ